MILFAMSLGASDLLLPCFLIAICFLTQYLFKNYNRKRRQDAIFAKLPGPHTRWPVIGSFGLFYERGKPVGVTFLKQLLSLTKVYRKEGLVCVYNGHKPYVFLFSPETVEPILSSSSAFINKPRDLYSGKLFIGEGLVGREGEEWRSMRRLMNPCFSSKQLTQFIPVFNKHAANLCKTLESNGTPPDINLLTVAVTLDITCETVLGKELNSLRDPEENFYLKAIQSYGTLFFVRVTSPWLWPDFIFNNTTTGKETMRHIKVLHNFSLNAVRERVEVLSREGDGQEGQLKPLVDHFIEYMKLKLVNENDVREQMDMLIFGGYETTGVAISYALYCLGLYPEIQEQLYFQLEAIFGKDCEREITRNDLKGLDKFDWVIKEALRLYPSIPAIGRELKEDVVINGYFIPRGTAVWPFLYGLHRNEDIFVQPDLFDPWRWSPERSKGRHPFSFCAMAPGPRNCIGQKYANIEEKIILAHILRKFTVKTYDLPQELSLSFEISMRPEKPFNISFTPRHP